MDVPLTKGASGNPIWTAAENLIQAKTGASWLDLAAGGGQFAARLEQRGLLVQGTDLENRWQCPEIPFQTSDLDERLPYEDETFDGASILEAIGFAESPSRFIGEVHRILKPAGEFIVSMPNVHSMASRLRFWLNGTYRWFPHPPIRDGEKMEFIDMYRDPIRPSTLNFWLQQTGFEVTSITYGGSRCSVVIQLCGVVPWMATTLHNRIRKGRGKLTPLYINSRDSIASTHVFFHARKL